MEQINQVLKTMQEGSSQTTNPVQFDLDRLIAAMMKVSWDIIPGFTLDEYNGHQFKLIAAYFSNHEYFEQQGHDFKKGLFIKGPIGTGKTNMMLFFSQFMKKYGGEFDNKKRFFMVSTREISKQYANEGYKAIDKYGKKSFGSRYTGSGASCDYNQPLHRCFDDFGLEDSAAKFYGQQANVMAEIILDRYDMFKEHGLITHLTTNIGNGQDIQNIYGDRVRSRIREMMNIIELQGSDRRK